MKKKVAECHHHDYAYYHLSNRDEEDINLMKVFKMVHVRPYNMLFILCRTHEYATINKHMIEASSIRDNIMVNILGLRNDKITDFWK